MDAGVEGDWATVRKLLRNLSNRSGQYSRGVMDDRVRTVVWSPVLKPNSAMNASRPWTSSLFAFKQTIALCPDESENVRRLVELLRDEKRMDDARLVLETGLKMNPGSRRLGKLADEFESKNEFSR